MFSLLRLESRFSVLFSTIAVVFKCLVYYVWNRALVLCSTIAVVLKCLVYYVWSRALVFCFLLLRSFLNV